LTFDPGWSNVIELGLRWFSGANDVGVAMADPEAGAGFDGLEARGRNENRGAESTLAYLSVALRAQRAGLA
jgi:hypothetical protein